VNHIKYLGVTFDRKITWRLRIEMITAKTFKTLLRIYSLFRSERLSTNIKLVLHIAFINSILTYVCPAWEFSVDTLSYEIAAFAKHGSPYHCQLSKGIPTRELHVAFNIPHMYVFITRVCRQQADVYETRKKYVFAT
jgi:hypothetical protein